MMWLEQLQNSTESLAIVAVTQVFIYRADLTGSQLFTLAHTSGERFFVATPIGLEVAGSNPAVTH